MMLPCVIFESRVDVMGADVLLLFEQFQIAIVLCSFSKAVADSNNMCNFDLPVSYS